jgi:hypothetical protein
VNLPPDGWPESPREKLMARLNALSRRVNDEHETVEGESAAPQSNPLNLALQNPSKRVTRLEQRELDA